MLVLGTLTSGPSSLTPKADSAPDGGVSADEVRPIALEAVARRRPVAAAEQTTAGRQAVAAYPLLKNAAWSASPCSRTRSTRSRATSRSSASRS